MHCPEIIAAYLEAINMIWMSQISRSQPLQPPKVLIPTKNVSALLKSQSIISRILSASQEEDPVDKVKALLFGSRLGADTMVAALESIQKLWHSASTPDHIRIGLCDLYVEVCSKTSFMEPQVVAIENLVELMNQLIAEDKLDSLPVDSLKSMWAVLPQRSLNPSLSNAIVRVSGCLVALMSHAKRMSTSALRNWGAMMADAGSDDKVSNHLILNPPPFEPLCKIEHRDSNYGIYRASTPDSQQPNPSAHSSASRNRTAPAKNTSPSSYPSTTP